MRADPVVIGRHDERDVRDPRVRQRAEDVVEKRPAVDGHHHLASRVGGAPLCLAQARVRIGFAHARAQAARQHERVRGHRLPLAGLHVNNRQRGLSSSSGRG